ncbi:hypothetical protein VNI00_019092 [Paramarasmius palmivorus]|uniref:Uncharacterized protein n=1 Tax=Paramarasmius palmivorus TaxID=297713 RepID=A0AAW0AR09_9AGAR
MPKDTSHQNSKVDRRQGLQILPSNRYRAKPPVDPPGYAPDTYTLTQHNPDKGITILRNTIEDKNGNVYHRPRQLVVTTTCTIHRRHPDADDDVSHVSRGTSPGAPALPTSQDDTTTTTSAIPNVLHSHPSALRPFRLWSNSVDIPEPNEIVLRPGTELNSLSFYIIFRGREVGLFYDYEREVAPRVLHVSRAAYKVYTSPEAAIAAYTHAHRGELPGYELAVIQAPVVIAHASASTAPTNAQLTFDVPDDSDSEYETVEVEHQVGAAPKVD